MNSPRTNFSVNEQGHLLWGSRRWPLHQWTSHAPVFLYDLEGIVERYQFLAQEFAAPGIFYAMKANSHPEILKRLQKEGAGVDVVSGGEIRRALECGFAPEKIVFSGVGKTKSELSQAISLELAQIHVESVPELSRIAQISQELSKPVSLALRINPDVDPKTHPYIATGLQENKFGIEIKDWPLLKDIFKKNPQLKLRGLSLHLGSQMLEFSGMQAALQKTLHFFNSLRADWSFLQRLDIGGGIGIFYDRDDLGAEEKMVKEYFQMIKNETLGQNIELQCEPGRWIVGHGGVLLTEIQYVKSNTSREFLIVNTGMHHLLRPALYGASHQIRPVKSSKTESSVYDVVGPICESADFLGKECRLPRCEAGEFLAIADVGAYGAVMMSNYNLQEQALEICLSDSHSA